MWRKKRTVAVGLPAQTFKLHCYIFLEKRNTEMGEETGLPDRLPDWAMKAARRALTSSNHRLHDDLSCASRGTRNARSTMRALESSATYPVTWTPNNQSWSSLLVCFLSETIIVVIQRGNFAVGSVSLHWTKIVSVSFRPIKIWAIQWTSSRTGTRPRKMLHIGWDRGVCCRRLT